MLLNPINVPKMRSLVKLKCLKDFNFNKVSNLPSSICKKKKTAVTYLQIKHGFYSFSLLCSRFEIMLM